MKGSLALGEISASPARPAPLNPQPPSPPAWGEKEGFCLAFGKTSEGGGLKAPFSPPAGGEGGWGLRGAGRAGEGGQLKTATSLHLITTYGAIPDGKTSATAAIQKALDAAAAEGGGTVIFPAGRFVTGNVNLRSNVEVHLAPGAVWLASRNAADYASSRVTKDIGYDQEIPMLISGDKLENVAITGPGILDGQAEHDYLAMKETDGYIARETELARAAGVDMKRFYAKAPYVRMVYLTNIKGLRLEGFTVRNSPNWTLHVQQSDDVRITGLSIYSSLERGVNADGLDIDDCSNVRISDCNIETGDDAICLKSTLKKGAYTGCENVTVTNCTLASTSTAIKLGTESFGYFRNIVISNCAVRNTNRGLGIFVRDGAQVRNVLMQNVAIQTGRKHFNWWGDGDAIHIVVQKRRDTSRIGSVRGVRIDNVLAEGPGTSHIQTAFTDSISDVSLSNIRIRQVPEPTPDKRASSVLWLEGVRGARLSNVVLERQGNQAGWRKEKLVKLKSEVLED